MQLLSFISFAQKGSVIQVNSLEFRSLITKSPGVLLDVRTYSEFENGHIYQAGQLNFYALNFHNKLRLLSKEEPIYLYCNTGYRSQKAAEMLVKDGYKNVYNLEHGIMEWNLQNYKVIIEPNAKPDIVNMIGVKEFNNIINSDSLVFVDFYAPWCGPCRKMMPMVDSLKVDYYNTINIVKVNADASKKLMKNLKMNAVPYFALYYKNEIIFTKAGYINRNDLINVFNENIEKYYSN